MPELAFAIEAAEPVRNAASPVLEFRLRATSTPAEQPVYALLLRCQIQIETPRRRYTSDEKERLTDLFGTPERWGQTLRPMLWTNVNATLPSFKSECVAGLHVPCSFDLNAAVTKYFYGLSSGEVPLTFLFSGTIFYEQPGAGIQIAPVSWNAEARFRFPVQVWQDLMATYYAERAWLSVPRTLLDELYSFKLREGFATIEDALAALVPTTVSSRKADA